MKDRSFIRFVKRSAVALTTVAMAAGAFAACGTQHEGLYITDDGVYYIDKNGDKVTGYVETNGTLYYFGQDGKLVEDSSLWPETSAPETSSPDTSASETPSVSPEQSQSPSPSASSDPNEVTPPDVETPDDSQQTADNTPSAPATSDEQPETTDGSEVTPPEIGTSNISELTSDLSACSQELLDEMDAVIESVSPGENATLEEKLWSVFEWMTDELKYQYITVDLSDGYTESLISELAEHAIFELRGACEHQAALYCLFARRLGCDAMVVEGEFLSDDGTEWVEHGWVILDYDGALRHCDVLFGRNHTGGQPRTMFLLTDEQMSSRRHRWDTSLYPACQ